MPLPFIVRLPVPAIPAFTKILPGFACGMLMKLAEFTVISPCVVSVAAACWVRVPPFKVIALPRFPPPALNSIAPPASTCTGPEPSAPRFVARTVPAVMSIKPEIVFACVSTSVPPPPMIAPAVPASVELIVAVAPPVTFTAVTPASVSVFPVTVIPSTLKFSPPAVIPAPSVTVPPVPPNCATSRFAFTHT